MRKSLPVRKNERLIGMSVSKTYTCMDITSIVFDHSYSQSTMWDRPVRGFGGSAGSQDTAVQGVPWIHGKSIGVFTRGGYFPWALYMGCCGIYNIDVKCKIYVYMYLCTCVCMLGMGDKNFMSQYIAWEHYHDITEQYFTDVSVAKPYWCEHYSWYL